MQLNTKIQNPTNFFFNQVSNETDAYADKIKEFTKKLINFDQCILCKNNYNFTANIPRILIHCGHSFCTSCLQNFHKNGRVRCPMCLKLVKQIESIERLPVNHTIFTKLTEDYNRRNRESGIDQQIDSQAALYQQFEASSVMGKNGGHHHQQPQNGQACPQYEPGQQQKGPAKVDEELGLEWCQFHNDRIKHFLCVSHKETCCRACWELFHAKGECNVADLYDIEDYQGFLEEFFKKSNAVPDLIQNGNYIEQQSSEVKTHFPNKNEEEEDEFEDDEDEDENQGDYNEDEGEE